MTNSSTALVTGANKGIGLHIARQLAEAGLTVYATARRPAEVPDLAGDVRTLALDVTDASSIGKAVAAVDELDILVNNAGILAGEGDPTTTGLDEFRRTYETNVFGVVAVTNAFLPLLRRSAHPRIVNISSGTGSLAGSGELGRPGTGASYRSSKAALNAITIFYAQALPEFRVNALAPGLRRTDLNERARTAEGDPAEAAAGAVRLALFADDGPTAGFFSWDGTTVPW